MAVTSRLFSLFTLSSLAVLICSLQATPAAALSIEVGHNARSMHNRGHDALAKRKRAPTNKKRSKRCKPRQAPSSDAPAPSSTWSSSSSKPSKSSSSSAPSQSSGGNNGGGLHLGSSKAGLGWPNGEQDLAKWKGISTIYTWNPACPSNAKDLGMNCCPMLWGWNQVDQFKDEVNKNPPKCVMGMNEPEITGQSNLNAQSGAQLWNQYIRPLKGQHGTTLISPACTSDPAGKQWYKDFFAACGENNGDKCGVDKLATHWYDVSGDALIGYLEDLHNTFGLTLWLTEFACQNYNDGGQCSKDAVWGFQAQVTAYMESAAFVELYMPFGAMHNMQGVNELNILMNSDGSPNALAKAYLSL